MNSVTILREGVAGTLLMTAFVYLTGLAAGKPIRVVRILGTMVCMETSFNKRVSNSFRALVAGGLLHYFIGVVFSFLFNLLWYFGFGRPDLAWCLIYGGVSGNIGVVVWTVFLNKHPNPPRIDTSFFLPVVGLGHLFFGLGVYLVH